MDFLKLIFIFIFLGSCSQIREKNLKISEQGEKVFQAILLGQFKNTDSEIVDLDQKSVDAIVIVFASDTCSTCATEANYWVSEFKKTKPNNILFVHYIIGGNVDDAADWKEFFKIDWDVLVSESDDLYKKYCPAILTPCLVIKNNLTNEVTQSYKPLRKEEIERYSGLWKN